MEVISGRPQHVRSRRPRDGQNKICRKRPENAGGERPWDVLGTNSCGMECSTDLSRIPNGSVSYSPIENIFYQVLNISVNGISHSFMLSLKCEMFFI